MDLLVERAQELGLYPIGCAWEADWQEELDELWPAIVAAAEMLLAGHTVTHADVASAVAAVPRAID